MLKFIRRGQRWVTGLFVIGIGGVFVFFIGLGGPLQGGAGSSVVEVGPYRFGIREFERVRAQREAQIQEAFGSGYDPKTMAEPLDSIAAGILVQRAVLALEAESLGLAVAKPEVERMVLSTPGFRDASGRFDRGAFEAWAEYEYGNQRNFLVEQRMSLLATKLLRLIQRQARVSEAEAREAVRRRLEGVEIAYVALGPDSDEAIEGGEVTDEAIAEFLASRAQEARTLYDERKDRYDVPEQVRARHVLLKIAPESSEEEIAAAETRAQGVLERLRSGEDFAALATELSDDPGSRENGGDLGFFRRGQMVAAFDEVAFSQEPGALPAEPVRTAFGFHVILVEERKEAQARSFEDVDEELAREILALEVAQQAARTAADALSAAVADGQSLETAAREAGLTLERTGVLKRRVDGYVIGLGAAQELLATAFSLEAGESSERVFEVEDKLALVQLLKRTEAEPGVVEAEVAAERDKLTEAKRRAQEQDWIGVRREALADKGQLFVNLEVVRGG